MPSSLDLTRVESDVRDELDTKYAARELALKNSRPIIRNSANAIRALHRGETGLARELMDEVKGLILEAEDGLEGHWDIYHAGFFYDAVKEYAEAELTAALL
jgi:translin